MVLSTKTKKQFIGFKNKDGLKKHISKHFPNSKIVSIGKRQILKGAIKSIPSTTSYVVTFKRRK